MSAQSQHQSARGGWHNRRLLEANTGGRPCALALSFRLCLWLVFALPCVVVLSLLWHPPQAPRRALRRLCRTADRRLRPRVLASAPPLRRPAARPSPGPAAGHVSPAAPEPASRDCGGASDGLLPDPYLDALRVPLERRHGMPTAEAVAAATGDGTLRPRATGDASSTRDRSYLLFNGVPYSVSSEGPPRSWPTPSPASGGSRAADRPPITLRVAPDSCNSHDSGGPESSTRSTRWQTPDAHWPSGDERDGDPGRRCPSSGDD